MAEKPVKILAEEVSNSKMTNSGPMDIMDKKLSTTCAVRILAEQRPFQLQQAFHELCF